jgi:hypothetical protein
MFWYTRLKPFLSISGGAEKFKTFGKCRPQAKMAKAGIELKFSL